MKRTLKSAFAAVVFLATGTALAHATCTTTAGDTCQPPAATTQSGIVINASSLLGLECLNSQTGTGNPVDSNYFFAVTTTNFGSTEANGGITNSGTGLTVVGVTPTHNGSATPSSTVTAGAVQGTKGGTTYYLYAQACPSGTAANGTNCSQWVLVDASQVTTTAYPTSVFAAPVKPTDATVNSIAARTNVPAGDVSNVSVIDLTIDDLITSANDQTLASITYTGNPGPYIVNDSLFTNGFKPNNKYQYTGQVQYPWDLVPTGGPQTEGPFWTTPENPGAVTASNVTHCSVEVTAQNSSVSTLNPDYTEYSLCATGNCQTSAQIGSNPSVSATITGLNPGTVYTPNATALVGDQDGTQTGWSNSGTTDGTNFTTLAWGGSFTITTISTGSAVFVISGLTGASDIQSWIITVNGNNVLSGSGDPTGNHDLSNLNANTQYNVQIELTETSGCSSTLPTTPVQFYTLPVAPVVPAGFGTVTSNSIVADWTDSSTNGSGTQYDIQYSAVGSGGPWTDFGNTAKAAGSAQSGTITGLSALTTYWVQVRTVGLGGTDSAFLLIGSTETLDTTVNLTAINYTVFPSSISLSVSASGGFSPYTYTWTATPSAGTSFGATNGTTAGGSLDMFYNTITSYNVCVTATDHSGAGPGSANECQMINTSQVPTTITINPQSAIIGQGDNQVFTATVVDQDSNTISGAAVTWTVGSCATLGGANPAAQITVTGQNVGTCQLTATDQSASANAAITVSGTIPVVNSVTISPNPVTGTTGVLNCSATAFNNDPMTYSWSTVSLPAINAQNPAFSASGSAAATVSTATFYAAGTYTIQCAATDTVNNQTGTKDITFNVSQTLNGITVSPNDITVQTLQTQQFMASCLDQFGNALPQSQCNVSWSTTGGGGTVSGAGAFESPELGQNIKVTASLNGKSGFAIVNVISFDVSGSYAYPVPYKASFGTGVIHFTGLGSQASIRIYTASGHKVFDLQVNTPTYDWNVKNSDGENLASGVYLYVIESPQNKKNGKLIIIQ